MKSLLQAAMALSAVTLAQAASAAQHEVWYYQDNPDKSRFTITLSGACSGKIEKPVSRVTYGRVMDFTNGTIDRDGAHATIRFFTSDREISAVGYNGAYQPGERFTESVKDKSRHFAFTAKNDVTAYFKSLAYGNYDDRITCKDGGSLSQHVLHWGATLDRFQKKTSFVSVKHSNSTDAEQNGQYQARLSTAGTLNLPGQCSVNGNLFSGEYTFSCSPPRAIRVKVSASAEGNSRLE
jgi:hypothetical protein